METPYIYISLPFPLFSRTISPSSWAGVGPQWLKQQQFESHIIIATSLCKMGIFCKISFDEREAGWNDTCMYSWKCIRGGIRNVSLLLVNTKKGGDRAHWKTNIWQTRRVEFSILFWFFLDTLWRERIYIYRKEKYWDVSIFKGKEREKERKERQSVF